MLPTFLGDVTAVEQVTRSRSDVRVFRVMFNGRDRRLHQWLASNKLGRKPITYYQRIQTTARLGQASHHDPKGYAPYSQHGAKREEQWLILKSVDHVAIGKGSLD